MIHNITILYHMSAAITTQKRQKPYSPVAWEEYGQINCREMTASDSIIVFFLKQQRNQS